MLYRPVHSSLHLKLQLWLVTRMQQRKDRQTARALAMLRLLESPEFRKVLASSFRQH